MTDTPNSEVAEDTQLALTGDGAEQPATDSEQSPQIATEPESESVAPSAATLRVLAQAGQSLPGVGRMVALHYYNVEDSPIVRARIEAGLLKLDA